MYFNEDFPYANGEGAFELDVSLDGFAECIVDREGNTHDVCLKLVKYEIENHDEDAYESQWLFDWSAVQNNPRNDIYVLYLINDNRDLRIQGRVAIDTYSEPCYLNLIENAPHNSKLYNNPNGEGEWEYDGIGPNMFAFACLQTYEKYGYPQLLFMSKSNLVNFYMEHYGATMTRNEREMWLSDEVGAELIANQKPKYGGEQYD